LPPHARAQYYTLSQGRANRRIKTQGKSGAGNRLKCAANLKRYAFFV
jgi:hypothetical protein